MLQWSGFFVQQLAGENCLAVPPVDLIIRTLNYLYACRATATLVVPFWPSAHLTNILFDIPEQFEGFDFRVQVPADKLQEVQVRYSHENNENNFQDYFGYLMEFYELQYPSNYNEAVHIFNVLMRHTN